MSEWYPYTTIVGYGPLGFDVRPLYKRQPKSMRTVEFKTVRATACDDLIRRVAELVAVDPPLDLRSHAVTQELIEGPSPLDGRAYKHREKTARRRAFRLDGIALAPARFRRLPGARCRRRSRATSRDDHRACASKPIASRASAAPYLWRSPNPKK